MIPSIQLDGEERVLLMEKPPSYSELSRRVRELEEENRRINSAALHNINHTEAKFQAILDTVDVHMSLINRDLNIVWANRKTRNHFGEDIVGRHCRSVCFGGCKPPCADIEKCLVRDAFLYDSELRADAEVTSPDGRKLYYSGTARVVVHDRDGRPDAVVKVYHDITEQKRAEEKLRKNLSGTIQAMAMTVETRDPYTAGHQRRTSDIARSIAQEMGLSSEQVDEIRMAGVIHDLGKISIPAEILSKPGQLSKMEYSLIKNHPETGFNILKGIDFNWPVAEIVRQHHERMDGSGYPEGLQGDKIMLEARIIGVADVIEAMSSHRPYRPSLGATKAFEEILLNRGVLYDPAVVDASIRLFNKHELNVH
jgi:PAS domain S-box-containing protein/putative nucleotidyltransferase with HDIG domain